MGSIAQGEAVTADNPQIFFAFQVAGKLTDVFSLKRSVFYLPLTGAAVEKVAEAALTLTDAPAGVRVGQGVYHANFTATAYTIGTHEIRWKYVFESGGPEIEVRQRFEVLDPAEFFAGRKYVGYANSRDLLKETQFAALTASEVQVMIDEQSRKIEQLTGRFFEPRIMTLRCDGKNTRELILHHPIIGVNKVQIESGATGVNVQLGDVSIDGLRVYARHLQGMLDPDDRDNPRIAIENFEGMFFQSFEYFPKSPQGVWVTGVFGYTEPDGSPFGFTPKDLMRVVGHLAIPRATDTFGQSQSTTNPSSIRSARTRDQAISYSSGGGGSSSRSGGSTGRAAMGGLTGDDFVDSILIPYVRPFHIAVV